MAAPSVTYTFTNGTTADGTQVSQNFTDLINGASDGTKDYTISALTCGGTATLNGSVILGNASSDDLTVNASLASTIPVKTTNSYDLGSSTLGLQSIYFGSSAGAFTTRLIGAAVAASWTMTLPTGAGTANYVLFTNGSGVTSWSQIVDASVSNSAAIAGSKLAAASASVAGAVTTGTQTMAGNKTFSGQAVLGTDGGSQNHIVYGTLRLGTAGTAYRGVATGSIVDDATVSYSLAAAYGLVMIGSRGSSYATVGGLFHFEAGAFVTSLAAGAIMETSTTATNSTGATDGKVCVSVTSGPTLYIINRAGLTIDINVVLFGY